MKHGSCRTAAANPEGAAELLEQALALAIDQPNLGPDDWRTATIRQALARSLSDLERWDPAIEQLEVVVAVFTDHYGADSQRTKAARSALDRARAAKAAQVPSSR